MLNLFSLETSLKSREDLTRFYESVLCDNLLIWWHTYINTIKLHIDINTSNVNMIMSHVDIIYIYLV